MEKMTSIDSAMETMGIDDLTTKHAMMLDRMSIKAFLLSTLEPMIFDSVYTEELREAIESI